jgi:hypothetical protein
VVELLNISQIHFGDFVRRLVNLAFRNTALSLAQSVCIFIALII